MQAAIKSIVFALVVIGIVFPRVCADEPARPGALVIVGGGTIPDEVRDRFMALAGGKAAKLVIIPTASNSADREEEEDGYLQPWRKYSPASLTLLHTRSNAKANDPSFVKPLTEATAIWLGGGDQVMLAAAYRGTAVEREFKSVLKRGGVIGGTSAGAAVMSDVMIEGGNPKPDVGQGFGFVTNAVIDQHFLRRSRLNRLLAVISERRNLIGIGIDEGTAFILQGGQWSVAGRSYVLAFAFDEDGKNLRLASFGGGDRGIYHPTGLPSVARSPRPGVLATDSEGDSVATSPGRRDAAARPMPGSLGNTSPTRQRGDRPGRRLALRSTPLAGASGWSGSSRQTTR